MNVTEVRIKLMDDTAGNKERLRAFCSITFDGRFVVRDIKIIEGGRGLFVAMPSRKIMDRCPNGLCRAKNHLRARYCNQCGDPLAENRAEIDHEGRYKLHADIAHPINSDCRSSISETVIAAYRRELELACEPGYVCRYDDPDHS